MNIRRPVVLVRTMAVAYSPLQHTTISLVKDQSAPPTHMRAWTISAEYEYSRPQSQDRTLPRRAKGDAANPTVAHTVHDAEAEMQIRKTQRADASKRIEQIQHCQIYRSARMADALGKYPAHFLIKG